MATTIATDIDIVARTQVRRVIEEIWNAGDLALADELFAPTYRNHGGLITDLVSGPEAISTSIALYQRAFPAFQIEIEALASTNGMVDLRWRAHASPSTAAAATTRGDRTGGFAGTTRVWVVNRQIQESWMTWDQVGVLGRLKLSACLDTDCDQLSWLP